MKGYTFQPQKLILESLLRRSAFLRMYWNVTTKNSALLPDFFFFSSKWPPEPCQYCGSVICIFLKQDRIIFHTVGLEVFRCSITRCVTSSSVLGPATTAQTCWLMFEMLMSVSWPEISQNLDNDQTTTFNHDLGPWPQTMSLDHDLRSWPRTMSWGYDIGT